MHGYPDGFFRPGKNVLLGDFLKLTTRAVGHENLNDTKFNAEDWAVQYKDQALSQGWFPATLMDLLLDAPLTRGQAFEILYTTLKVKDQ